MNIYDATEQAYKNGYEQGYKDALNTITTACSTCETITPRLVEEMVKILLSKIK